MFIEIELDEIKFNVVVDSYAYYVDNHIDYTVLEVSGVEDGEDSFYIQEYSEDIKHSIKKYLDKEPEIYYDDLYLSCEV